MYFHPTIHLIAHKLSILRDISTEPQKFRELVKELAALLTYEATANLLLKPKSVTTPMGIGKFL